MSFQFLTLVTVTILTSIAYGCYFTLQPASLPRSLVKVIATLCLVLFSFLANGPVLLTVALACGALGDWFLSLRDDQGFLPGLGSFLIGHFCFVVLFAGLGGGLDQIWLEPWRMVAALLMAAFSYYMVRKLLPKLGALTIPVLLYIFVILGMGMATLTLPLHWTTSLVILGAFLFVASDSILAHELFLIEKGSPILRITAPTLWFLYWGGQVLITAGILL